MSQTDLNNVKIRDFFLKSPDSKRHSWQKGEFLCMEGDDLNLMHYLETGRFRIFRTLENGREMLYRIYLPGSVIGDIEVFSGINAASCSVQCIENAETLSMPMKLLQENPAGSGELLYILGRGIARKLHENSVSEAVNTIYPLEVRLAHYFLSFEDPELQAGTLGQLAGWMGCSYRHLTRSLAGLRRKSAIRSSSSGWEPDDKKMLETIAAPLLHEKRGRVLFEPGE
ncbi:MAG: cyclic nucleotide-binding domain-containing protein [Spirochaetales bacterium]|uniref:Cyclic nucleotide-binding domain-containing protein n=1 Tax=Candidatus Thalassospirochaeta sargassi TaxID=3119039 RepID=A0AAJ1MMH1_9SPIO|nr:cyclic nucleotide-binding domain-containing protein [Spirochaetales bacterium]